MANLPGTREGRRKETRRIIFFTKEPWLRVAGKWQVQRLIADRDTNQRARKLEKHARAEAARRATLKIYRET